ncbi:Crp/Fnr family transcriptional regulator [Hymenobacter sp. UV11]|uniref:Crp/Fnr family transcriptional regulator n=1 Tax=Hymenobacter sp. UV11 TaxID=1849735 RepID=UPI0010619B99|nr:Crp/Fnr family transcriptional regulator [Hymenobacter sp. UV11]TDN36815.1 cyclic nucleotide-binding protein [Hymenobacter sp. UV11]TFZ63651.1 Crp/Fnr family transcriptional regulator [Hymenobacter sp. UV11]
MLPSLSESVLRLRQHLTQFAPLSDEDWRFLVPHLRLVPLARHAVFAEQGRVAADVAFVLDGMFRQYYTKDGEERTSYFFFEDQLMGGYFSSLTGRPSLVTIEALSAGCCLTFPYAVLVDLFSRRMAWQQFGRRFAEYLAVGLEERMVSLLLLSPAERYEALLVSGDPRILARVPQHYIANFLGVTPVSLSRIRNRTSGGSRTAIS